MRAVAHSMGRRRADMGRLIAMAANVVRGFDEGRLLACQLSAIADHCPIDRCQALMAKFCDADVSARMCAITEDVASISDHDLRYRLLYHVICGVRDFIGQIRQGHLRCAYTIASIVARREARGGGGGKTDGATRSRER